MLMIFNQNRSHASSNRSDADSESNRSLCLPRRSPKVSEVSILEDLVAGLGRRQVSSNSVWSKRPSNRIESCSIRATQRNYSSGMLSCHFATRVSLSE